ncbi:MULTISPECIES: hypothetical protein [unclassified Pseudomonas]|uniref:hypothetical protein n=1 Tax=unclassified Pseudomonas TaxID=196821 RepID=UPI00244C810D|nr:hypothetical protein [Pseudomonas sp. GD03944]MDH1263314.1 hypothetical protein [Pseudomonas sp. GD03944]
MELDLDKVVRGLSDYCVNVDRRPDGSVLLTVAHDGHRLKRVVDNSFSADEIVSMIKFDLVAGAADRPIAEAVKYCSSTRLPTYTRRPIRRTRSASLWAMRKIRDA